MDNYLIKPYLTDISFLSIMIVSFLFTQESFEIVMTAAKLN